MSAPRSARSSSGAKPSSDVRPAGSILVDGVPVDVVSEGAYIEKGERVCVTEVHGSRIVVRRVSEKS